MAKYEQPTSLPTLDTSTLDSLCQDLDSFISELKDTLPPDDRSLPSRHGNTSLDSATATTHQSSLNYHAVTDAATVQPRVLNSRPPVPFYDNNATTTTTNTNYLDEAQERRDNDDSFSLASPPLFPQQALVSETPKVPVSPPLRQSSRRAGGSSGGEQQQPVEQHLVSNSNNKNNYLDINSNNIVVMPRTSSLDRASSSSSSSAGRLNRLRSNGSATDGRYKTMRIDEENEDEYVNAALLSNLSQVFLQHVQVLNKTRRIFCTDEYPLSFNGEEAVYILRQLIPDYVKSSTYRKVARTLMHIKPPLISPIAYSERSVRKNTLYESPHEVYTIVESTLEEGIAQCVYTSLTNCYSISCRPGLGGCYAPCCPYRDTKVDKMPGGLRRNLSMGSSSLASSHDTSVSRAWQATVPREILQSTPEQEVKRQEAIHELIYTEEDYVRDLNLLDELFAKPLRTAQCIEPERRDAFCDNVFNNYLDILKIHKDLNRDLRDYQSLCQARSVGGFVDQVGDIFLRHINKFMAAYTEYGPHVVLGEYAVKRESSSNMLFQNFVRDAEKRAECRKLPFRHFLVLPVTRLQRYPLLLDAVLKRTPEDHPDKDDIARCIEIIRSIGSRMNELADGKRMTLRIYEINDRIKFKPGEPHDLRLSEKGRKLLHEGTLIRRSHMGVETSELHVFLFDHLLLMTKPKGDNYQITKRPIPLELLHLHEGTEGFSLTSRSLGNTTMSSSTGLSPAPQSPQSPILPVSNSSSLIISHLGRHGGDYLLYAENPQQRLLWKQKIVEAKTILDEAHPERRVFEIRSLSDTTFGWHGTSSNHGKITCSTAFIGARGIRMVAIGTELGVWMGIEGDTNNLRKVLSMDEVTQIGVLEEHHIFLVLADKTLVAYALDSLDPTAPVKTNERPSHKIAHHVSFFSTGVCNGRTLVFVKKKKGIDSLFRGYEPVCGDLRDPRNAKYLQVKTGFLSKVPSWFKLYKEFYIGAEASALQFLKARLAVVCIRGFEIIDLNHLSQNHNLPELRDPSFQFVQERCEQLVPLGMFRCRDNYLLCYDAFAFMVDIKGRYVREGYDRIDWEGNPQAVAFSYPYVVAFDPRFIEVRHVETGELVQVLAGENMRCLQYKQNAITPPIIHGTMTHPFKPEFQYVFHLVGTFEPPLFWH